MANRFLGLLVLVLGVITASPAKAVAQDLTTSPPEPEPQKCEGTCVSPQDLEAFLELAEERKCLDTQSPNILIDPINIVVDKQGRIFYSGKGPKPFKLKMKWCHYEMEAQGEVKVLAAVQEPPTYGFRLRPKAYTGLLLAEPFRKGRKATDAIDAAGLMLDPFYVKYFNLNFHVGFRSVGVGVGMDIFRSFGVYAGYALAWDGLHHNPEAALWFAFW